MTKKELFFKVKSCQKNNDCKEFVAFLSELQSTTDAVFCFMVVGGYHKFDVIDLDGWRKQQHRCTAWFSNDDKVELTKINDPWTNMVDATLNLYRNLCDQLETIHYIESIAPY